MGVGVGQVYSERQYLSGEVVVEACVMISA